MRVCRAPACCCFPPPPPPHHTQAGASDADAQQQLRQRVSQLEALLEAEQAAKAELNRKLQKTVDKVADLEDQLAEVKGGRRCSCTRGWAEVGEGVVGAAVPQGRAGVPGSGRGREEGGWGRYACVTE